MFGEPLLNGAAPPCAAAGRGANSLRPPAAAPVAATPFRKFRREPRWLCGNPASHSLHMGYFESAGAAILGTNPGNKYPDDATRIKNQWFSSTDQLLTMIMGGEVYLPKYEKA